MKKFALMLAVALPALAFTSCGEDDPTEITLDKTTVSVNVKSETQITPNERGGVWTSDNDFIVSVQNNNQFRGEHCGTTTVRYTKDGKTATCQVTVEPIYNDFILPVIDWGTSLATIQAFCNDHNLFKIGDDPQDGTYTVAYGSDVAGAKPWYIYDFSDNKLDASSLYMTEAQSEANGGFSRFLGQWFKLESQDGAKYILINGNDRTTATTQVTYGYDEEEQDIYADFVPMPHTAKAKAQRESALQRIHKLAASIK